MNSDAGTICTVHDEVVWPHGAIVRCASCGEGRKMTHREQVAFMLVGRVPTLGDRGGDGG